jgi:hypothetical protein
MQTKREPRNAGCSIGVGIHTAEIIEMHNRFPFVLHMMYGRERKDYEQTSAREAGDDTPGAGRFQVT